MEDAPLRVCVYGSSSRRTRADYLEASSELGRLLAGRGHVCVNGGGNSGCMGAVNEGCLGAGGSVVGVLHRMWMESEGGSDSTITEGDLASKGAEGAELEFLVADGPTLTQRKEMLADGADCFIALPGGPGTFEELWEIICQRQLGLPPPAVEGGPRGRGPVCLVNTDGYYDGFMMVVQRAQDDGLLHWEGATLVAARPTPEEALAFCEEAVAEERAAGGAGAVASAAAHESSPVQGSSAALQGSGGAENRQNRERGRTGVLVAALAGAVAGFALRSRL